MNCIYQLIRKADGVRTPPGEAERHVFADVLRKAMDEAPGVSPEDLVVVLMEHRGDKWIVSTAPLVTVQTFVERYWINQE